MQFSRRGFLRGTSGALIAGAGLSSYLQSIFPAYANEASITPQMVSLRPEIVPVVKWIETTPRAEIMNLAADELKKGLPYRELLAGLFLAGIRNIKPRPVGFKFHAVLAVNSIHQLSLDSPESERLLPLFWSLDYFKAQQQADISQGDWALGPVDEARLPSPTQAGALFDEAMEDWDAEKADAAVTALARSAGRGEIMERFWPYGARNYRNIGHNIIFVAHAFRTLDVVGWQHAEPVLRSLAFGILDGQKGEDSAAPFEPSRELVKSVRKDWTEGKPDRAAVIELIEALRTASPEEAAKQAAAMLNRGVAAQSIWDGLILAAGEFLVQRPGVIALHGTTSINSMRFGFHASGRDETRLLLLFQAAAWIPLYRIDFAARNQPLPEGGARIDKLEPADVKGAIETEVVLDALSRDRMEGARTMLAYFESGGSAEPLVAAARSNTFRKASEVHDFKLAAAAFEEFAATSPEWRPRVLAASAFSMKPTSAPDARLLERMQAAAARIG